MEEVTTLEPPDDLVHQGIGRVVVGQDEPCWILGVPEEAIEANPKI
jgi:hypothetical protein